MVNAPCKTSHPQQPPEPARAVVRFRAVVVGEDRVVAAVAEERAAQVPDRGRRFYPARGLEVEGFQALQRPICFLVEEFDPHSGGHVDHGVRGLELLARFERGAVVAEAPAAFRTFLRAVAEKVGVVRAADHVGLAPGPLHFMEGAQLLGIRGDALRDAVPRDARVAVHMLLESGFERF